MEYGCHFSPAKCIYRMGTVRYVKSYNNIRRISVDLSKYLSTSTYMIVRLRVVETSDYRSDIAIDDITFNYQISYQISSSEAEFVLSDSSMYYYNLYD